MAHGNLQVWGMGVGVLSGRALKCVCMRENIRIVLRKIKLLPLRRLFFMGMGER